MEYLEELMYRISRIQLRLQLIHHFTNDCCLIVIYHKMVPETCSVLDDNFPLLSPAGNSYGGGYHSHNYAQFYPSPHYPMGQSTAKGLS